jgi:DNA polymerase-3 subunit beta
MQFTAKRDDLLDACRKLARLLPDQSPVADMTGILLEADESDGSLRMLATNLEVTLRYRLQATVAVGGRMVVNGKLLANMMPLLGDDYVTFLNTDRANVVRIENGEAFFEISCLSGSHYPEPQNAPPDKTVRLRGLGTLAGQTAFAAVKKAANTGNILMNARLEIFSAETRMTCTDGAKLAIARYKWEASGQNVEQMPVRYLLPIQAIPLIADVCGDKEAEIGMSGNTLILTGPNFKMTTRTIAGVYPDTNSLLSQIKPAYTAIVSASAFWEDLDRVSILAGQGDVVNIALRENGVALSFKYEDSGFSSATDAVVYNATPEGGFYYSAYDLHKTLRYMEGNLSLAIDRTGNMLLKTQELCYLLTPRRPRKAAATNAGKQPEKKKTATRRKKAA